MPDHLSVLHHSDTELSSCVQTVVEQFEGLLQCPLPMTEQELAHLGLDRLDIKPRQKRQRLNGRAAIINAYNNYVLE
ncbi:hypothetical protein AOLI_G00030110 [Acnodon oligacanthus]